VLRRPTPLLPSVMLSLVLASVCLDGRQRSPPPAAPCAVAQPTATFSIRHAAPPGELSTDPTSAIWRQARSAVIGRDCSRTLDYPDLRTEVRGFWTDTELYFLFISPYRSLNIFLPPTNESPRRGLWDRDVVEMFVGDDWSNIRHYREYEIAPTGDWIDLAIDLDHPNANPEWRSGWKTSARIDEHAKVWYAACRIPLKSVPHRRGGARLAAPLHVLAADLRRRPRSESCAGTFRHPDPRGVAWPTAAGDRECTCPL
jgi:hypothetical protein